VVRLAFKLVYIQTEAYSQLFDTPNEILEIRQPADFASGFFSIGGDALVWNEMTFGFVKELKGMRDQFNQGKNHDELARALKVFAEQFEAESEGKEDEGPEAKSYSPEDLDLVCYMTLT
jgi:hypothetical protein